MGISVEKACFRVVRDATLLCSRASQISQRLFGSLTKTLWSYTCIAGLILVINIVWAVWAKARYAEGVDSQGYGEVYTGDCSKANRINTLLHFLINALSTLLLCGSNAFLTTYSAPCREEIDTAHAKGEWVDIGIPSFRNLRFIAKRKAAACVLLFLTSLPFNLIYNSLIFSSTSANEYNFAIVREDFRNISAWPTDHHETFWFGKVQSELSNYDKLDAHACASVYTQSLISNRRNVLVVTDYTAPQPLILEEYVSISETGTPMSPHAAETTFYYCPLFTLHDKCFKVIDVSLETLKENGTFSGSFLYEIAVGQSPPYPVLYCLSEQVNPYCSVRFSWNIMVVILVCAVVKLLLMIFMVLRTDAERLLVTTGDGISSFLLDEDHTTDRLGLARRRSPSHATHNDISRTDIYRCLSFHWGRAVTDLKWFIYSSSSLIGIFIGSVVLGTHSSSLTKLGFGHVSFPQTLVFQTKSLPSIPCAAILANTPQLLLSAVYLLYQNVIVAMFLANDYNSFALKDQALMVSSPVGQQRSNWLLGAPVVAGIFLQGSQILLHWLVSQAFFPVGVIIVNGDGTPLPYSRSIVNCSFSPLAALLSLSTASMLVLTAWGLGRIKLKGRGPPVASTCSVAISAACHPPKRMRTDSLLYGHLRWGAVDDRSTNIGHCSFAPASAWHAGEMHEPIEDRLYL